MTHMHTHTHVHTHTHTHTPHTHTHAHTHTVTKNIATNKYSMKHFVHGSPDLFLESELECMKTFTLDPLGKHSLS